MSEANEEVAELKLLVARGEHLVGLAAMVGDQDDFHAWRHRRYAWMQHTLSLLSTSHWGAHLVGHFRETVTVPTAPSAWHDALPAESQHLREGLELLRPVLDET